jgi:hypothetical protein
MQNEFEKQVQQKMEELNLVPSDPVWQKVEMQISKKKDRRRLLFWIPVLALLLGGGLWWAVNENSKSAVQRQAFDPNEQKTSAAENKTIRNAPKTNGTENDIPATDIKSKQIERPTLNQQIRKSVSKKIKTIKPISLASENPVPIKGNSNQRVVMNNEKRDLIFKKENKEKENKETEPVDSSFAIHQNIKLTQLDTTTAPIGFGEEKNDMSLRDTALLNKDSVKADTSFHIKQPAKKPANTKWKYSIVANTGASGVSRINFFNGQKSFDVVQLGGSTSSYPGPILTGPSPVQKSLSFSIGGLAQKQLSQRLLFTAGIQYNYYSNRIRVGNRIQRDTVLANSFSVSQYYVNRSAFGAASALQPYHNHYNFISVPFAIDWQLLKKIPLNLHTGFSVQRLIQTNALVFEYGSQVYFHNKDAFNKTQLFTEWGLSYTIPLKKNPLQIGPQWQYAFNRLEKNNANRHLFSYGLKVQLQLKK